MGEALPPSAAEFHTVDLRETLEERYLQYALSTITQRALPDARDGLKPVHRRILHAMRLLRLDPDQGFKKCARVVGDVIGKYHPHGEQSVYDALVRLAQDFAVRYPLVEGQGNFGNIDGDGAAAQRYTEARLTDVAMRLLEGLTEDAVDFRSTYDGEEDEPLVLPANFPNLLANGSSGIAVGMATSIPPHNVAELCAAAEHLINDPEATTDRLVDFVRGPDFPTGGILVEERAAIVEAYETGRGGFRVRARWEREDTGNGTWVAVVTEIPWQVPKSRLVEKIAELLLARRLPLLKDVRDESAEDVRLVLEPKNRTVDPVLLMESLFKLTELESRISLNMNVLDGGAVPKVMGLGPVLKAWLAHRQEVLVRRTRFRLEAIARRLEVLDGYLVAYLNLDEVISIIRTEDEPKSALIARFSITDNQAEAILNMRLRALRKLEEIEIRGEHDKLVAEGDRLDKLVKSDKRQWGAISAEIRALAEAYGPDTELGARRTRFESAPEADLGDLHTAMVEREPITVVLTEKGWIRALKGHLDDAGSLGFKSDDRLKLMVRCQTTDKLLLLSTAGKVFTLAADRLPGGRGFGEPVRIMADMEPGSDIVELFVHTPGAERLIASDRGDGFVVPEDDLVATTRKGKQVLNVKTPAEAAVLVAAAGDRVAAIGSNRKLLIFGLDELPRMGRGKGIRLQKYGKDVRLSDVLVFSAAEGMSWTDSSGRQFNKPMSELADWIGERAQAGRVAPQGFPRTNRFRGA